MVGLEAGGIDENELGGVVGVNAGNAVARGLGFFTGNADFLSDKVVHQRGFADIGASDDGDEAAAVVGGMAGFVLQESFDAALGIKSTETIECRQTLGRLKNKSAIFLLFSKDGVARAIAALLWQLAARQLCGCCLVLCR